MTPGRLLDTCIARSMKSTNSTHLRKTSMTMMHRALSALSSHVVQCLWCPHGMIVQLAGPRSIMGTWWLNTTVTRSSVTSSVLTRTQSMSPVARPARMVRYCTPWKDNVNQAHSRVVHMFMAVSWHAQCVPSNRKTTILTGCQRHTTTKKA